MVRDSFRNFVLRLTGAKHVQLVLEGQIRDAFADIEELLTMMNEVQTMMNEVQVQLSLLIQDAESSGIRVDGLERETGNISKELGAAKNQIASVHRGLTARSPLTASAELSVKLTQNIPLGTLDEETVYAAIEEKMRGTREEISNRQAQYVQMVKELPNVGKVVDLGCGRGEFLSLLQEEGVHGVGVDLNTTFVAECQTQGLEVQNCDALTYLTSCPDSSMRAVVAFQVLEHLSFATLVRVLAEAYRVLLPGGLFLGETPNGANLAVGGSTFWIDHTHVRPLHPDLLKTLADYFGFDKVKVDLVSLPEVPWRLDKEVAGQPVSDAVLGLQEYVLSGQDALLVAYRPVER